MAEPQETPLTPECEGDLENQMAECESESIEGSGDSSSEDEHMVNIMPVKVEPTENLFKMEGVPNPTQSGSLEFISRSDIKDEPSKDSKEVKIECGEDSDISLDKSLLESNLDSNSDDSQLSCDSQDHDMTKQEEDGFEMTDLTLPVEAVLQHCESEANSSVTSEWSIPGSTSTSDSLSASSDNTVPGSPTSPARLVTRKRRRSTSSESKDIFLEMVDAEVKLMKMRTLFLEEELAAKQQILKKEYLIMEYEKKLKQVSLEITKAKIEMMQRRASK